MSEPLPYFRYFPDPLTNGSIIEESCVCECCKKERSHIYRGPIYSEDDHEEVCPWCIADGTAAANWGAIFNDFRGASERIPHATIKEVEERTPGFSSWQDNFWLSGVADAMIFIGEADGQALLDEGNEQKIEAVAYALSEWGVEMELADITPGGSPAVYLFHDPQAGRYEGYADFD